MEETNVQIRMPHDLLGKVLGHVVRVRRGCMLRRAGAAAAIGFLVIVAAIPVVQGLVGEIAESGFFQFASLTFSDFQSVANAWQDYTLTLLESFPALRITELFLLTLVLATAIRLVVRYLVMLKKRSYAY